MKQDVGNDGRQAVAYGMKDGTVPSDLPYAPDVVVLRQGDRFWSLDHLSDRETDIGQAGYLHEVGRGVLTELHNPVLWPSGSWAVIDLQGLTIYQRGDEKRFIASLAREVLAKAESVKGDPEAALSLIRASGSLLGVIVPELVIRLEAIRVGPDETLLEIYERSGIKAR